MKKAIRKIERDCFCQECESVIRPFYVMREMSGAKIGTCGRCCEKNAVVVEYLYTLGKRGYEKLGIDP